MNLLPLVIHIPEPGVSSAYCLFSCSLMGTPLVLAMAEVVVVVTPLLESESLESESKSVRGVSSIRIVDFRNFGLLYCLSSV